MKESVAMETRPRKDAEDSQESCGKWPDPGLFQRKNFKGIF